jgi:hypothetical protein
MKIDSEQEKQSTFFLVFNLDNDLPDEVTTKVSSGTKNKRVFNFKINSSREDVVKLINLVFKNQENKAISIEYEDDEKDVISLDSNLEWDQFIKSIKIKKNKINESIYYHGRPIDHNIFIKKQGINLHNKQWDFPPSTDISKICTNFVQVIGGSEEIAQYVCKGHKKN